MKPRKDDPLVRLILDNADAARQGARAAGVVDRDLDDVTQIALMHAWLDARRGTFTIVRHPRGIVHAVRAFLFTAGRLRGLHAMRSLCREAPVEDAGERVDAVTHLDPEPRLEARSELRAMVRRARLRPDVDLAEHVDPAKNVHSATLSQRRRKLRAARGK